MFVITRAAHRLDLIDDDAAVFIAPLLAGFDERFAADLVTIDALFGQMLIDLRLGSDARMVDTDDPTRLIPLHARTTNARVLDGVAQGMAHMQNARYVRRRDDHRVRLRTILAKSWRALEESVLAPRVEERFLPFAVGLFVLLLFRCHE